MSRDSSKEKEEEEELQPVTPVYEQRLPGNKRPSLYYHYISHLEGHEVVINAPIFCSPCEYVYQKGIHAGERCKRNVCIGIPYCRDHMRMELSLEIKRSKLPNAGLGLFAYDPKAAAKDEPVFPGFEDYTQEYGNRKLKKLPKDYFYVVEYRGRIVKTSSVDKLYGEGDENVVPYAVPANKDGTLLIDAAQVRGIGSIANDATLTSLVEKIDNNCIINIGHDRKTYVIASRNIYHGDELYCSYGDNYTLDDYMEVSTNRLKAGNVHRRKKRDLRALAQAQHRHPSREDEREKEEGPRKHRREDEQIEDERKERKST